MTHHTSPHKGQLSLLAIIPFLEEDRSKALWISGEKNPVSITIEKLMPEPHINQIVIATNNSAIKRNLGLAEEIDIFEIPSNLPPSGYQHSRAIAIARKVYDQYQEVSRDNWKFEGLMLVDPFYQSQGTAYIKEAINIYTSQSLEIRPWASVSSLTRLPNHFHPKKIVSISVDGSLEYFDQEGRSVYRRQQLDDDNYYLTNGAIFILDPMIFNRPSLENDNLLGYVVGNPMVDTQGSYRLGPFTDRDQGLDMGIK